jgi:hypothetical protein
VEKKKEKTTLEDEKGEKEDVGRRGGGVDCGDSRVGEFQVVFLYLLYTFFIICILSTCR